MYPVNTKFKIVNYRCICCKRKRTEVFTIIPKITSPIILIKINGTTSRRVEKGFQKVFDGNCEKCKEEQQNLEELEKKLNLIKKNVKNKKKLIEELKNYDIYEILLFLIQKK